MRTEEMNQSVRNLVKDLREADIGAEFNEELDRVSMPTDDFMAWICRHKDLIEYQTVLLRTVIELRAQVVRLGGTPSELPRWSADA